MDKLTFQHWVKGLPSPSPITRKRAEEIVGKIPVRNAIARIKKDDLIGLVLEDASQSVLIVKEVSFNNVMKTIKTGRST
jgi:hypothetical protein